MKRTPLYNLHMSYGAKIVPFAGYEMPVQYATGVKSEHHHTRRAAGLFDISHMGQLKLLGEAADVFLESLTPADVVDLPVGRQRYALLTSETGGIIDDIMITRYDDCLYLVVNAACKDRDITHIESKLPVHVELDVLSDRALIAVQGPSSGMLMKAIADTSADMVFMDSSQLVIHGVSCFVSRSGYTGEDGFEISIPEQEVEQITRRILEHPSVALAGLGARDSLRLESGLCLYGHDIDLDTTPVEASLSWTISKKRRNHGQRAGGFPGATKILEQLETGQVLTKRVGLIGDTKAPVREGAQLIDDRDRHVGRVTSGTFGPSVEAPVAMALINSDCAELGTKLHAVVRNKAVPMTVTKMPFVKQRYYRG